MLGKNQYISKPISKIIFPQICGEGGFTCQYAPAKFEKVRKQKVVPKKTKRHLDELGPFLLECGLDASSKFNLIFSYNCEILFLRNSKSKRGYGQKKTSVARSSP